MSSRVINLGKMSKKELVNLLEVNFETSKKVIMQESDLFNSCQYTIKMYKQDDKKVTKNDLISLIKQMHGVLKDKFIYPDTEKPKAENLKKVQQDQPKEKEQANTSKENPKEEKQENKAENPKEETPKETKNMFPEELKIGESTFRVSHSITSMEELMKQLEGDKEVVLAFYWTPKLLRQFKYFTPFGESPSAFAQDLDLTSLTYVSDEGKVAYSVSMYTEAIYTILPKDLKEVEGIRYSNCCEYQIYVQV